MTVQITFSQYIDLVKTKIEDAQRTGNKAEAVRLFRLLRETCDDQIKKLETAS